ncbi:MAG TPA: DUF86 domain-containing protein [Bacillota bacterium]|nr:DUF86 domain-containing protein [Bacillota bacterium]
MSTKLDQQLLQIDKYMGLLKGKQNISKEEFINDETTISAVEHWLQLTIEGCINIGAIVISSLSLEKYNNYSDIFLILGKNKIIPSELINNLVQMAKFRNRLVHLYWEVDAAVVYEIYQTQLVDIEEYIKAILKLRDDGRI